MKEDKGLLIEILKWVRIIVIFALAAAICIFAYTRYQDTREPEITSAFINGKLEAVSELITSKLIYTGLIRYSEGNIPFLTKNSFSMIYTADLRAGIDMSKAQIEIAEDKVIISLPECEVQSVEIEEDSIEFYDEQWALFNWTEKTDVIDAISAAKEDVLQKADIESLLANARFQAETLMKGLLEDAVGDRELVIQ